MSSLSRQIRLGSAIAHVLLLAPPLPSFAASTENSDAHAHEHEHEEHDEVESIVVTASPLEHDRDELSVPVDRLDRYELLQNLGSTLGESLNHVPGLASTGFSGGASRPVIRGQDAYRTEVLEDGLGTHDVSRESPDHAIPVNPLAAQRIEVVRGPATLRYGGGASAGVVNVITNRVPDRLTDNELEGEVFAGIGLVANERDVAASLNGSKGNFAFHADGLFRRSNDYSIPNDDKPHIQSGTHTESWMGAVGGAYLPEWGRVGGSYSRAENKYGIPNGSESIKIDMHSDRFRFEADVFDPVAGIQEIRLRSVYSDYKHDEIAEGVVGQTYRNEEVEGRLEILHETFAEFTGALGIHARHRDFQGEGEAAEFLSPTETTSVAVYFFEERPLSEDLILETGFRVEHTRVQGVDAAGIHRDLDFTPLSGAIGFILTPNTWLSIGLNGSVSQRAPSQVELLARGVHEATNTFEIGDSTLGEETSYTGDIRIEIEGSRGRIEWSSFVTQYDDFIFAALTGALVGADDELNYVNRDALFWGTEVAAELDLFELESGVIGIDGRFDFVRAQFDSNPTAGGRDLPRIVPIRWGGGLFYKGECLDARAGFLRTEAQEKIGDFERPTKSFTMLNATLTYHLDLLEDIPLNLSLTARNLTDVRARNHISFNKDAVLLPGRSLRFALQANF